MERWKDIAGYEGIYQISSLGKVRSLPKSNYKDTRILNPGYTRNSTTEYKFVYLYSKGVRSKYSIHRLVASHFIPNPESKPFVNHIDNNGSNNNVDNLEWCTHSENMKHAYNQGRLNCNSLLHTEQQLKKAKSNDKIMLALGSRLVSIEERTTSTRMRKYVTFKCERCTSEYTARADSEVFKAPNNGICRKCAHTYKGKKI